MKSTKEFILFLWERFVGRARNIRYGRCRWDCRKVRRILIDEGMCWPCYEDYCDEYK
jgi:hypothetical protein